MIGLAILLLLAAVAAIVVPAIWVKRPVLKLVLILLGLAAVFVAAIPVVWIGSAVLYQTTHTYTHRFRLTLEVETPAGLATGSSVINVTKTEKADWLPTTTGVVSRVEGEAVFVDLGGGRHVIATLGFGPNGADDRIARLAVFAFRRQGTPDWYREAQSWPGRAELSGDLLPTLVTFGDLNDPKSARVVRPDMLEQVFGQGVRFRRAFIEMVPAGTWPFTWIGWPPSLAGTPVTRGIEGKLPAIVKQLRDEVKMSGRLMYPNQPYEAHISQLQRGIQ